MSGALAFASTIRLTNDGGLRTDFHGRRGARMVLRELDFRRIGFRVGVETVEGAGVAGGVFASV